MRIVIILLLALLTTPALAQPAEPCYGAETSSRSTKTGGSLKRSQSATAVSLRSATMR